MCFSIKNSLKLVKTHSLCYFRGGKLITQGKNWKLKEKINEKTQNSRKKLKNSRNKLKVSANLFGRVAENRSNFLACIRNKNIPEKLNLSKPQKPCNFWGKRNTDRWQVYALGQFFSEELYYSFFSSSLFKHRSAILSGTVSERGNGGEVTVQFRPEFKLLIFSPLSLSGSLRAFNSNAPHTTSLKLLLQS